MPLPRLAPLKLPLQVSRPKGSPECFEAAVQRLAPFEGVWTKEDGRQQELSETLAREVVEGVARRYNTNLYLEQHAPRRAAIIKKLKKLKRRCEALGRELDDLSDLTVRIIYGEAVALSGPRSHFETFESGDVHGLLREGRGASPWRRRVSNLNRSFEILLRKLPKKWERQGHNLRDKGGKRNHYVELEGTANWRLRTDGLYIYQAFKPDQATGTENNDLHQFVDEIREYATGLPPNDGMIRPLRDLIKPTREENQLRARNNEILLALEDLARGKTIEHFSDKELRMQSKLYEELDCNRERLAELSKITWPHAPLPSFRSGHRRTKISGSGHLPHRCR